MYKIKRLDVDYCFFLDIDYVFGNRKFGGNAQSITKSRWIHHTSFLWDYEVRNMAYLRHPKRVPDYREVYFIVHCIFFSFQTGCIFYILVFPILSHTIAIQDASIFNRSKKNI